MERKSIFLIDLSSLIKENTFKKGILSSYHVNKIVDILNIFSPEIILGLKRIIFLSDKTFRNESELLFNPPPLLDKKLAKKYKTLLKDYEIIIYPGSEGSNAIKKLKKYRILSVVSYANIWYREILQSIPEMELYDYNRVSYPRSVVHWGTQVNYIEPEMKLIDKQSFFTIEEELKKVFSEKLDLSQYDEKTPRYYEVELVENENGDLAEGRILQDDELPEEISTFRPNQLLSEILEVYLTAFTDLLNHKTKKILDKIKSHKSEAVFIYGKDQFLKQKTAEYLLDKKKIRKFEYDLLDGFPDFTSEIKNCELFYFKNLQCLSFQRQLFLWNAITDFSLGAKSIIFDGERLENIAFGLRGKITPVHIQTSEKYGEILTKIFLALVFKKLDHHQVEDYQVNMLKIAKENKLRSLLSRIHDINTMDIVLQRNHYFSSRHHLSEPTQWYLFLTEAAHYESNPPKSKSKKFGYFMKYLGDYWEISFNYAQPLLVEKRLGLNYIAYMMAHEGKDLSATFLRNTIQQNVKVPPADSEKNVQAIRKSITDAIKHIANLEDRFDLQSEFSDFLTETFFPNRLSNLKKSRNHKEDYFRDIYDKCKCVFPSTMNFHWELISTPVSNERKS